MAASFLLALVAVGVSQAAVPEPCQGGPMSWCQDVATAAKCHREQYCRDLWDSLWDAAEGDVAEEDAALPGRKKKCSLCIKILEQVKAMAGEDPDEAAVEAALGKACRAVGKYLGRLCKRLVKKYREQLSEALQNGEDPQDTCAAVGFCKA
ncbi:antimicrobial peptide NK-lysin-like [Tyto alba]|uniref:antimicrobial peptide NK-lysin-like n=1 Tax=Tyto alba TaxID=56313 RepID=UPI001C66901E|nr:antimicrobial peptide NK-lysin-like [Tyto alba]XP_042657350.1 antimicrobial peptide NK-lysin-like [Tyto alba]